MTGAFLWGFFIFGIIFLLIAIIDDCFEEFWGVLGGICLVLAVLLVTAIPISRIDSKQNATYAKVFQETLDYNRANVKDLNLESATILKDINECNEFISKWKVKGENWYNNKWYYHPDTQDVEFIK